MSVDRSTFLALCQTVSSAAEFDLTNEDRELLLALHRAISELKTAVENALLNGSTSGRVESNS